MAAGKYSDAQLNLQGTVFDSSKINLVEGVRVVSTGGMFAITDSMGRYSILVNEKDSVTFIFRNKPTQKFPVQRVTDPYHFDISLRITVKGKYKTLNEVVVHGKSYREDSIENRQTYADVFDFRKPGVRSSLSPDGVAGADLDELINMFRFGRTKHLKAFQKRLEFQEKESYVTYRFNPTLVKRITGLQGAELDAFLVRYRPDYEFIVSISEAQFDQYILDSSYKFKVELLQNPLKKAAN